MSEMSQAQQPTIGGEDPTADLVPPAAEPSSEDAAPDEAPHEVETDLPETSASEPSTPRTPDPDLDAPGQRSGSDPMPDQSGTTGG